MEKITSLIRTINQERILLIVRYCTVGGGVALFEYVLALLLNSKAGIFYVVSTISSATIVLIVQFLLQKFFTFKHTQKEKMHVEFMLFLLLWVIALILKTFFVVLFVEVFHFDYIFAQFASIGLVALGSFFFYRIFIFK